MLFQLIRLQMLIYKLRRHINGRLGYNTEAVRSRRQSRQYLPDTFRKRGSSLDTVRNICADLHRQALHSLKGHPQPEQLIQPHKNRGGIRASAGHAGRHGYFLLQVHVQPFPDPVLLPD